MAYAASRSCTPVSGNCREQVTGFMSGGCTIPVPLSFWTTPRLRLRMHSVLLQTPAPLPTLSKWSASWRSDARGVASMRVLSWCRSNELRELCGLLCRSSVFLMRSEEHTSELQSLRHLVCRLLLD